MHKSSLILLTAVAVGLTGCSGMTRVNALSVGLPPKDAPKPHDAPREALEFFALKRAPDGTGPIPWRWYRDAARQSLNLPIIDSGRGRVFPAPATGTVPGAVPTPPWEALGPGNIGGRTRALVIDPATPATMYAAGVAGGVWKSTDSGATWTPLDDLMGNLAVSALVMDPADSSTLYAGTGEGLFNVDAVRGAGIFKTTDAGANWSQLAATDRSDFHYVNDVVVSPNDSTVVYAATRTGVWRSTDSGASWSRVLDPKSSTNPSITVTAGCTDLEIRTDTNPDIVFAACGSFVPATVYRLDASVSSTWEPVYGANAASPDDNPARIELAIAPSDQDVIYALAASAVNGPDATGDGAGDFSNGLYAVLRSGDGGDSWTIQNQNTDATKLDTLLLTNPLIAFLVECELGSANQYFNQGWYDSIIVVDPTDENVVWAGGIDLFRSDDAGVSWGLASYWWLDPTSTDYVHADQHNLIFHPDYDGTTNTTLYATNDGGLYQTDNPNSAPATTASGVCYFRNTPIPMEHNDASDIDWVSLNNGYEVTQFYDGIPYPAGTTYFGGTQDNGTLSGNDTDGVDAWDEILGGDGGYVAVNPDDPSIIFAETTGISIRRSTAVDTNGDPVFKSATSGISDSGLFINPFEMDPTEPGRMWTTGFRVWRTDNADDPDADPTDPATASPVSWEAASAAMAGQGTAIGVALANPERVLVGTTAGRIYRTNSASDTTGLDLWESAMPRSGYVSSVAFDPNDPDVAYATYSTFGGVHVWKSVDGGATWTGLDGTGTVLPDIPVHSLVVDPDDGSNLWVGTDLGVYTSTDGGANWGVENSGFANVITETLQWLDRFSQGIYAFTHGRGAYRLNAPDKRFLIDLAATSDGSRTNVVCTPPETSTQFDVNVVGDTGYGGTVNLSVTQLDGNLSSGFDTASVTGSGTAVLSVSDVDLVAAGDYPVTVTGDDGSGSARDTATIRVTDPPTTATNDLPADGTNTPTVLPTLSWSAVPGANSYTVEIDDDPGFGSIDVTATTTQVELQVSELLAGSTTYHWRVTANHPCGATVSTPTSFATPAAFCSSPGSAIVGGTITDTLSVGTSLVLADLDVALLIDHTYVGDLVADLTHQATTSTMTLLDQPGLPATAFGCSGDDIAATFDDDAADPVEDQCDSPIAIHGQLSPEGTLSDFNGEDFSGDWTLTVADNFASEDDGTLRGWCLIPDPANDPPTATPDSGAGFETDEDSPFTTADVLANDSDPDMDPLGVAGFDSGATAGLVTDNGDGTFDYDPNGQFESLPAGGSDADAFDYTVSDGQGGVDTATVTIMIAGVNDGPAFTSSPVTNATIGSPYDYSVTTADPDTGDTATLTAPTLPAWLVFSDNGDGTATLMGTPTAAELGDHPVSLQVEDGQAATTNQDFTIAVDETNDPPTVMDDGYSVDEDAPLIVPAGTGVLTNDTDPEGGALTAVLVADVASGMLTLNDDGSFDYVPVADFNGSDAFMYRATDPDGGTSGAATVTLTVNPVNDAPIAVGDSLTVPTGGTGTILDSAMSSLLANDSDIEGDPLAAQLSSAPSVGMATVNPDGTFSYTHDGSNTLSDSFDYQACDPAPLCATATVAVSITAQPVNQPPVAVDDSYFVEVDSVLNGDVGLNDSDADGDLLSYSVIVTTGSGALSLNPDGTFSYTPDPGFNGHDRFSYEVSDGIDAAGATVEIAVGDLVFASSFEASEAP